MKTKLRQGDPVIVIAGKEKGKTGKITSFVKKQNKVLIEGLNIVKKTKRSESQENKQSRIIEKSMPLHISNVMFYSAAKRGERLTYKLVQDKKLRMTVNSKEEIK